MPECRKCREEKPLSLFAKNSGRGKPIVTLCKLCVSEQAKLSFREKRFGQYLKLIATWPEIKLISETAWLEERLKAVGAELAARTGALTPERKGPEGGG